jgi:hypothetical protein
MMNKTQVFIAALVAAGLLGAISVSFAQPAHAQGATSASAGVGSGGSASAGIASAATGDTGSSSGAGVTSGECTANTFFEDINCKGQ